VASCEKRRLIVGSYPSETQLVLRPKVAPEEGAVRDIRWGRRNNPRKGGGRL